MTIVLGPSKILCDPSKILCNTHIGFNPQELENNLIFDPVGPTKFIQMKAAKGLFGCHN